MEIKEIHMDCEQLSDLLYDRCLKYGFEDADLAKYLKKSSKDIFRERIKAGDYYMATYVFSRHPKSRARETLLFFVYRLKLFDKKLFADFLISVYNMTQTNTSLFGYFSYDTLVKMFDKIEKPYLSIDSNNDFKELPDTIKIYRGIIQMPDGIDKIGFSWSTKKHIARNFSDENGYLISGTCYKKDIIAYLTNRGESEIIIDSLKVNNKEIV